MWSGATAEGGWRGWIHIHVLSAFVLFTRLLLFTRLQVRRVVSASSVLLLLSLLLWLLLLRQYFFFLLFFFL